MIRGLTNGNKRIFFPNISILFSPFIKTVYISRNPHKTGILIGRIINDRRMIFWDPQKAFNPHILIIGPSGSGKTETLITILKRAHSIYESTIVFIDVRGDIAKRLRERNIGYHLIEIPEKSLGALEPYYTTPWIRLYQVFDSLIESYEINDLRLQGIIFELLRDAYEYNYSPEWGDIISSLSKYSHEGISGIVERIIREVSQLDKSSDKHYDIVRGDINVISLRSLTKEREELLRFSINMIFQDIMNMMSRNNPDATVNTFFGLDEAWILLSRRGSRRIINLLRLARGYGLSIAMATQSFRDFGELWDLVVENTGLLIVMSNPNKGFWEESLNFLRIGWRTLEDLITLMRRGDAIIRILPDPRAIPVSIERIE